MKVEIEKSELDRLLRIEEIVKHTLMVEKIPGVSFICGEAGEKDKMGLPEYFFICPAHGLDGQAIYKKHKDYSAPGY